MPFAEVEATVVDADVLLDEAEAMRRCVDPAGKTGEATGQYFSLPYVVH